MAIADYYGAGVEAAGAGETAEAAVRRLKIVNHQHLNLFLDGFGVLQNPARRTLFNRCVDAMSKPAKKQTRTNQAGALLSAIGTGAASGVGSRLALREGPKALARAGQKPKFLNPALESVEAYEDFHGKPPDEYVTVTERVHHHGHLASAGELRRMVILSKNGKYIVKLSRFDGAILAFNEQQNQLFIKGGDQSVNLKDFGIRDPHEVETLGRLKSIDYFTDKTHLGSEGGTATYRHKFRTTNENGRHVTVRIAEYPDVIYYVRDERMVFSGGSYEILREGIDK